VTAVDEKLNAFIRAARDLFDELRATPRARFMFTFQSQLESLERTYGRRVPDHRCGLRGQED
jgi:hypothetical protein